MESNINVSSYKYKDDVLFSSLFPTIKLSHPEAERKFQKIVFEVFSFLHLYRLGRKDGEAAVKIKFNLLNPINYGI